MLPAWGYSFARSLPGSTWTDRFANGWRSHLGRRNFLGYRIRADERPQREE
jgi:hypothetical protein